MTDPGGSALRLPAGLAAEPVSERLRRGAPGPRPIRHPARPGPDPRPARCARIARARPAGRAHRWHQRQGQHPGDGGLDAARGRDCASGQTPKPHLVSYRERIVVDGLPIAAASFAALLTEVLDGGGRVERRHGPPTEFEALTCAAFLWFAPRGGGRRGHRGGAGRPAGRHQRVGRRRGGHHQRVARPHGVPRARRSRPSRARRRPSSSAATSR